MPVPEMVLKLSMHREIAYKSWSRSRWENTTASKVSSATVLIPTCSKYCKFQRLDDPMGSDDNPPNLGV